MAAMFSSQTNNKEVDVAMRKQRTFLRVKKCFFLYETKIRYDEILCLQTYLFNALKCALFTRQTSNFLLLV